MIDIERLFTILKFLTAAGYIASVCCAVVWSQTSPVISIIFTLNAMWLAVCLVLLQNKRRKTK